MVLPEIRLLQAAIALAEELNFSRAAERLRIRQSTLSKRIVELESQIDMRLFERNHQVVKLTEAGRYFVEDARSALDHHVIAESLLNWRRQISDHWSKIRFGSMQVKTEGEEHRFQVQVYLDELNPDAVQVELYADALDGYEPVRHAMVRGEPLFGESAWHYSAVVSADPSVPTSVRQVAPQQLL